MKLHKGTGTRNIKTFLIRYGWTLLRYHCVGGERWNFNYCCYFRLLNCGPGLDPFQNKWIWIFEETILMFLLFKWLEHFYVIAELLPVRWAVWPPQSDPEARACALKQDIQLKKQIAGQSFVKFFKSSVTILGLTRWKSPKQEQYSAVIVDMLLTDSFPVL
jgi:hypothetical protein